MIKKLSIKTIFYASTLVIVAIAACITNYRYYDRPRPGPMPGAIEHNYTRVFSYIYRHNIWQRGSGEGSDPIQAGPYMALLQDYINDPRFKTIVDLGCGDWQIMRQIKIPADKSYRGFDVVPSLIKANKTQFRADNVHFHLNRDLRELSDKKITGDLLIVKDVVQHWPKEEIDYFIANVLPNFKYALITNKYEAYDPFHNKTRVMGFANSIGLLEPPFNLQNTVQLLEYDGPDHKQVLFYTNPNNPND